MSSSDEALTIIRRMELMTREAAGLAKNLQGSTEEREQAGSRLTEIIWQMNGMMPALKEIYNEYGITIDDKGIGDQFKEAAKACATSGKIDEGIYAMNTLIGFLKAKARRLP